MRLSEVIDTVFRQGHLSERALVNAVLSGERPHHLDRCDICAERGVQLARWMDELKADATEMSDEIFTPERLGAQQSQIMRRLEQLDHPARVIAFPAATRPESQGVTGRRVAVSWVGVAAAAGLLIGVVSGQLSARLTQTPPAPVIATIEVQTPSEDPVGPVDTSLFESPLENVNISALDALNDLTPRLRTLARSGG